MSNFDTSFLAFNEGSKATRAADFYSGDFNRGIENLVERCGDVVSNNGEYIIDELVVIYYHTFHKILIKKVGT